MELIIAGKGSGSLLLPFSTRLTLNMAGYRQIQRAVKKSYGFVPSRENIAFVALVNRCVLRKSSRSRHEPDPQPCSLEHRLAIEDALRYFQMLPPRRYHGAYDKVGGR
jgi:hypothetical protein